MAGMVNRPRPITRPSSTRTNRVRRIAWLLSHEYQHRPWPQERRAAAYPRSNRCQGLRDEHWRCAAVVAVCCEGGEVHPRRSVRDGKPVEGAPDSYRTVAQVQVSARSGDCGDQHSKGRKTTSLCAFFGVRTDWGAG